MDDVIGTKQTAQSLNESLDLLEKLLSDTYSELGLPLIGERLGQPVADSMSKPDLLRATILARERLDSMTEKLRPIVGTLHNVRIAIGI